MKIKEFKIGDQISILRVGSYYPGNSEAARKMHATKWIEQLPPEKGQIGTITGKTMGDYERRFVYLIDLGDREIIIGEQGIREIKEWDDETNGE